MGFFNRGLDDLLRHKKTSMSKLKIAIQKKGRLSKKSLDMLKKCGITIPNGSRKLKTAAKNFPMEVLFLRDDDIPQYVEQGVADIGIVGQNELLEKEARVVTVQELGFAGCKLSLAIPREETYTGIDYFNHKKIATSYPNILRKFLKEKNIHAEIEEIGGSVEISPGIGLAEGIFDLVSTGSTLTVNGLKEVEVVTKSEGVLIRSKRLETAKREILDQLIFRICAVRNARENKYILLNAPNSKISEITAILPGMKSPTITSLAEEGWSSLQSVVREDVFWDVVDQLKGLGAQGVLVLNIEKMIV